jgi:IS30 family transposase
VAEEDKAVVHVGDMGFLHIQRECERPFQKRPARFAYRLSMRARSEIICIAAVGDTWFPLPVFSYSNRPLFENAEVPCPSVLTHLLAQVVRLHRSLFIQARGVLKKELLRHLRSRRMMRRAQVASTASQPRGHIVEGIPIRDRPADIEDRAIPGHWEGDLITGAQNTHLATLVERQSRFTMLVKVPGKDTASVVTALCAQIRHLPTALRRSLTWDRGIELAQQKQLTRATKVDVYFCDPQSPWQRGTNENTNRLLRQYFPKGTTLSQYSQADLDRIALRLNQRPRKTLGFQTAAAILETSVARTG